MSMDERMLQTFDEPANQIHKSNTPGVLKGMDNGILQFISVAQRDQEFIDHALLPQELIGSHIQNGFIIDLQEEQQSQQTSYVSHHETFPQDLQNAIFQIVNTKQKCENGTQVIVTNKDVANLNENADKETIDQNFLAIEDHLLTSDSQFKIFHHQPQIEPTSPTLPPLRRMSRHRKSLLLSPNDRAKPDFNDQLALHDNIHEGSVVIADDRFISRKILPHKKRISKKLKIIESCDHEVFYQDVLPDDVIEDENIAMNPTQFSCQICGQGCDSQLDFFAHLKGHYEPIPSGMEIPEHEPMELSMKSNMEGKPDIVVALNFNNFEDSELHVEHEKMDPQQEQEKELHHDTVIQDHIDLTVDDIVIDQVENASDQQSASIADIDPEKASNVPTYPAEKITIEEIEFSDTEDMLEGIRGVVDKVQESVDDTCDEMDIISSASKSPWFTHSTFNGPISNETRSVIFDGFTRPSDKGNTYIAKIVFSPEEDQPSTEVLTTDPQLDNNQKTLDDEGEDKPKAKRGRPKGSIKKKKNPQSSTEPADPNDEFECKKKKYFCEECRREFKSCNALKYHDQSFHAGKRLHQCDVCGKSFYAPSALKAHLRVHSGDKPYECEECHRKFRQWGDLRYHMISIHTNEKNYQCEFCGKSFSRKYSLVIHRRIHTSERNYKCEFCSKSFRASSYLQNHRKIHTGEKPYECKTCAKKFRVCGDLRRHERTHERNKKLLSHITEPKTDPKIDKSSKINHHNARHVKPVVQGTSTTQTIEPIIPKEENPQKCSFEANTLPNYEGSRLITREPISHILSEQQSPVKSRMNKITKMQCGEGGESGWWPNL